MILRPENTTIVVYLCLASDVEKFRARARINKSYQHSETDVGEVMRAFYHPRKPYADDKRGGNNIRRNAFFTEYAFDEIGDEKDKKRHTRVSGRERVSAVAYNVPRSVIRAERSVIAFSVDKIFGNRNSRRRQRNGNEGEHAVTQKNLFICRERLFFKSKYHCENGKENYRKQRGNFSDHGENFCKQTIGIVEKFG